MNSKIEKWMIKDRGDAARVRAEREDRDTNSQSVVYVSPLHGSALTSFESELKLIVL